MEESDTIEEHLFDNLDVQDEEHPIKTFIKRGSIIVIALLLIFLILSGLGIGPQIVDLIAGKLASHEIDDSISLVLDDGTVIQFTQDVYNALINHYDQNREHEFKVCFQGDIKGRTYVLNNITYPKIYSQHVFQVVAEPCSPNTLVPMHSHPDNRCLKSVQDIRTHRAFKKVNPNAISAVMCSKTRFGFYQ